MPTTQKIHPIYTGNLGFKYTHTQKEYQLKEQKIQSGHLTAMAMKANSQVTV